MWKVPYLNSDYDEAEAGWLRMSLQRLITMGNALRLRASVCRIPRVGNLVTAVSSGTVPAHGNAGPGDRSGDEVIVPALTFIADVNVVRMAGAACNSGLRILQ
jgi:dTDP-4-amino-4,6-dideoxygalactose transaminase